ncbi:MAG: trypsin-like peptidase domain-containing protein [Planctomycetota bacterium]
MVKRYFLFLFSIFIFFLPICVNADSADVTELEKKVIELTNECMGKVVSIKAFAEELGRCGTGSGAIISPDGYILTCAHVVPRYEGITVILSDGRKFKAKRLGQNAVNDFAVIKIDADNLPYFELGNSDAMNTGDWVFALGHPGGIREDYKPSVSFGRVKGLHRKIIAQSFQKYYNDAILTDTPLTLGSSGGPLIDMSGKLIGINGVIIIIGGRTYSTSSNQIKAVVEQLKEGKDVTGKTPESMAQIVEDISKDLSPEEWDDYTTKFMKELFGEDASEIFKEIQKWLADKRVKALLVELLDNKDQLKVRILLEDLLKDDKFKEFIEKVVENGNKEAFEQLRKLTGEPENDKLDRQSPDSDQRGKQEVYLGIVFSELSDTLRSQLSLSGGFIVEAVKAGSPAYKANIKPSDIILKFDDVEVSTVPEAIKYITSKNPGDKIKLTVLRKDGKKKIEVTLESK